MNQPKHRFSYSVTKLTRLAAVFALLGLCTFAFGLLLPLPLPVIFSMSIGHGLGILAVLLYLMAVLLDVGSKSPRSQHKLEVNPLNETTPPESSEEQRQQE